MHITEILKRWLIKELTDDTAVSGLVAAHSVAGMENADETPTRPGVYVRVPGGTPTERFLGSIQADIVGIAATEAQAFTLLDAVASKFENRGADLPPAWVVPPRGSGLRISRVKVDRTVTPVNLTAGGTSGLYACTVNLSFTASAA